MTNIQMAAIAAIEAQQQDRKRDAVWMVGEQLKDICRREPESARLICQDLTVEAEAMGIQVAEKKIAARAKENKVGSCGCVTPYEAEEILREFYGLPGAAEDAALSEPIPVRAPNEKKTIDLTDFL